MSLEREYARELVKYTRKVRDICLENVPYMVDQVMLNSIRADDWTEETTENVESDIEEDTAIMAVIVAMFNKVKRFAQAQQEKVFRSMFGGTMKRIEPRKYEMIKQIWVNQNLSLIKSIDSRTMEAIRYTLSRNVIRTVDREMVVSELKESIMHMADVNEKRAALIACDQVGKLNSQLAQYEQVNQGVESYIWQTMEDSRVRAAHEKRNQKPFRWDDPPDDGHPGWAYRCRCTAIPQYDTDKIGLQPKAGSYKKV